MKRIAGISIMGGSTAGGNVTAAAEFNIYADPEAAARVFASGANIRMCGLNLTHQVLTSDALAAELRVADASAGPVCGTGVRLPARRDGGPARRARQRAARSLRGAGGHSSRVVRAGAACGRRGGPGGAHPRHDRGRRAAGDGSAGRPTPRLPTASTRRAPWRWCGSRWARDGRPYSEPAITVSRPSPSGPKPR